MVLDPRLEMLFTVFLSIILETLPFILIGSVISGLLEIYVKRETLLKFIPKNKLLSTLVAPFFGLVFPVCECGIMVIARRLLKKGVPSNVVITYMLAGPVINPIVLVSTFFAFQSQGPVYLQRSVLAYVCAVTIGLIMSIITGRNSLVRDDSGHNQCASGCSCHSENEPEKRSFVDVVFSDLLYVFMFLSFGAFISSSINTLVPRDTLVSIGSSGSTGVGTMMVLAFILSVCSEADAFIAASYTQFSLVSKLAFLVFGPMLDIKLVMIYLGTFKRKYAYTMFALITLVVFLFCAALEWFQ